MKALRKLMSYLFEERPPNYEIEWVIPGMVPKWVAIKVNNKKVKK